MRFMIERNQGPAGFEKVLDTIQVEDGKYPDAITALRAHVITPFNLDHQGKRVTFENVRPTLAIAKLDTDHDQFSDDWICTGVCEDEGFSSDLV